MSTFMSLKDALGAIAAAGEPILLRAAGRSPTGDRGLDELTLVTCWPFDAVAPGGPLRYVVVAEADGESGRRPDQRLTMAASERR